MNRQTYFFVRAALLGVAVFASCQDYTPNEATIFQRKTADDYEKAFNAEFPIIDPEQNWGFYPMPICGEEVDITRGMNTNSNEWESVYHYEVPGGLSENDRAPWGWSAGDISNYERAYVYWWFSTHQWPQTLEVRWSEFFVENVWGQPEHGNVTGDPQSTPYFGPFTMGVDFMQILDIDKIPANSPYDHPIKNEADALTHGIGDAGADYEDINNFNAAGGAKEQVMYAYDVSSEDWFYRESHGTSLKDHNNWTIQYINGNYYLAYDYWSQKKNGDNYAGDNYSLIKPDGYYNDWIIKLSSGKHIVDSYTRRIMCEDLGNTFDWDFNDLVFDVTIYNGNYGNGSSGYYAQITLQAAGGTLPIYIGQKDQAHEAHFLFGVESNVPVNVDAAGGVNRPAVVFHLPLDNSYQISEQTINGKLVLTFDPNQIPIYVTRDDMPDPANAVKLTTEKGKAPQKFACPCDTYWMKEFKNIEGIENKQIAGHPNFAQWVATGSSMQNDDDAFITERSKDNYPSDHFQVLYSDANGSPFSVSFSEDGNVGTIQPWKDLWNSTFNDPLNSQFTEVRSYPKHVTADGSDDIDNTDYTTYSTTFQAQAPYIYETVGADDDPTAYTALNMKKILDGGFANQEAVWGPYAKTVSLETNDGSSGYVLGSGYYAGGTNVLIQAVPRKFYKLDRWEDMDVQGGPEQNTLSRDANYTIVNLSANRHLKAHFARKGKNRVNIEINPANAGTPYLDHHQEAFQSGTEVDAGEHNMHVTPATGYVFDNWNNDEDEWWNEIEFDVDGEDITLIANLRPAELYTITVQANDDSFGRVCLDNENSGKVSGKYYESELNFVRAYATPNPGYRFVEWTDDAGNFKSSQARYDFYPEEVNLIAHFESMTSYYSQTLATLTGPFNNGYDLFANVNGLSNYSQCCLEVTYTGNPSFGYNDWDQVQLPWAGQSTTDYVEVLTNRLRINSGGGDISKIVVRVKPQQ